MQLHTCTRTHDCCRHMQEFVHDVHVHVQSYAYPCAYISTCMSYNFPGCATMFYHVTVARIMFITSEMIYNSRFVQYMDLWTKLQCTTYCRLLLRSMTNCRKMRLPLMMMMMMSCPHASRSSEVAMHVLRDLPLYNYSHNHINDWAYALCKLRQILSL